MRLELAGVRGALVTLFGSSTDLSWILGTWSTPLIVVIVLCLAAGMGIDRALVRRARSPRKSRAASSSPPA